MEPSEDPKEQPVEEPGLMTLGQAAAWLGWKGKFRARKLNRTLIAVERRIGREIMVRRSKWLMVTKGALMRWAPEICPRSDEVSRAFRTHLRKIDKRIDNKIDARVTQTVELQISKIWEFLAQVTESVNQLGERLARISSQIQSDSVSNKHRE